MEVLSLLTRNARDYSSRQLIAIIASRMAMNDAHRIIIIIKKIKKIKSFQIISNCPVFVFNPSKFLGPLRLKVISTMHVIIVMYGQ